MKALDVFFEGDTVSVESTTFDDRPNLAHFLDIVGDSATYRTVEEVDGAETSVLLRSDKRFRGQSAAYLGHAIQNGPFFSQVVAVFGLAPAI